MELRTRPIEQQEHRILSALAVAQDRNDNAAICHAELDVLDFYSRAGCFSPAAALLAALLIAPAALADIRQILPDSTGFDRRNDKRLYEAMLYTPAHDLKSWWPLLAKVSGLALHDVLAYMNYDFSNCANVRLYAAQLLNEWAYNAALDAAQHVIEEFVNGQTMSALNNATGAFGAIREHLEAARPLVNGGRGWSPDFKQVRQ